MRETQRTTAHGAVCFLRDPSNAMPVNPELIDLSKCSVHIAAQDRDSPRKRESRFVEQYDPAVT